MTNEITHYWSIVKASNPQGVTFRISDGTFSFGFCNEGELPQDMRKTTEPRSFIGYHPETSEYGFTFGNWIPISEWLLFTIYLTAQEKDKNVL